MSVGTLLGLPAAKGLFRKAIAQSGAASSARRPRARPTDDRDAFLDELGLEPATLDALRRSCRRERSSPRRPGRRRDRRPRGLPFQPVVDGTRAPAAADRRDRAPAARRACALLIGTNARRDEAVRLLDPRARRARRRRRSCAVREPCRRRRASRRALIAAYRKPRAGATPHELWSAIVDRRACSASRRSASPSASSRTAHRVDVPLHLGDAGVRRRLGRCHALEIPFVFDNLDEPGGELFTGHGRPSDLRIAWRDARRRGSRSPRDGRPEHDGIRSGRRYEPERRATMRFDETWEVVDDPARRPATSVDGR